MNIGKYEIHSEIGKGGFGTVYLATDTILQRQIALKVLHPNLLNSLNYVTYFKREAQVAANLEHPNIVPVYDFGQEDGRYFIAMAYMPNGSLKDRLSSGRIYHSESALSLVRQVAKGISFAHEKGVIHRDLKPGNVLFDNYDIPKVADMGFAKKYTDDSTASMSTTGGIIGTPAYMPPELWDGKSVFPSTDIYSLALIFIELLTGKQLFTGDTASEVMLKHFMPFVLPPEIKEDWKPIIEKALARNSTDRFQKIDDFIQAFDEVSLIKAGMKTNDSSEVYQETKDALDLQKDQSKAFTPSFDAQRDIQVDNLNKVSGESPKRTDWEEGTNSRGISSQDTPPQNTVEMGGWAVGEKRGYDDSPQKSKPDQHGTEKSKIKKIILILGIILGLLLIGGPIILINLLGKVLNQDSQRGLNASQPTAISTNIPINTQPAQSSLIRSLSVSEAMFSSGQLKLYSIDPQNPHDRTTRNINIFIQCLGCGREDYQLTEGQNEFDSTIWSPDGSKIAAINNSTELTILDPINGTQEVIATGDISNREISWSPDGREIAYRDLGSVMAVDLETHYIRTIVPSNLIQVDSNQYPDVMNIDWSDDGQYLGFWTRMWADDSNDERGWTIWTVRADGTELRKSSPPSGYGYMGFNWIQDQHKFLFTRFTVDSGGERGVYEQMVGDRFTGEIERQSGVYPVRLECYFPQNQLCTSEDLCSCFTWEPDYDPEAQISEVPIVSEDWPTDVEINRENASNVSQFSSFGEGVATRIVWNPYDTKVATATTNGIIIFDGTDLSIDNIYLKEVEVTSIAWSPDGQRIAASEPGGNIYILNAQTGIPVTILEGHEGNVKTISWSNDGEFLASGSTDNTIRIWDGNTYELLRILEGHTDWVRDLAWSPDGKEIASASDDKLVKIWNAQTGQLQHNLSGHTDYVITVGWSPDGNSIASAGYDESVRLWDANSGQLTKALTDTINYVDRLTWSPDSSNIAMGSDYGVITFWDGISNSTTSGVESYYGFANDLAYSKDGKTLAVIGSENTLVLWDMDQSSDQAVYSLYPNSIYSVAWSPKGDVYAAESINNEVLLFNNNSFEPFKVLRGHSDWVRALSFAPDGEILASGSDDGSVMLWDTNTWNLLSELNSSDGFILTLAWSNSGQIILTGTSEGKILLWNPKTGSRIATLNGHDDYVRSVVWSPDDRFFVTAGDDNQIHIWETSTKQKVETLTKHTDWVRGLAWSPDGSVLASSDDNGYCYLWDTSTWTVKKTLLEDSYGVGVLEWSPNGEILAMADFGGYLELWNPETGEVSNYLHNHTRSINDIVWSPDGSMIVTGSNDGTIRLWGIP